MMIEATDFRDAMSLLTSAVSVVTTAGMADRHGFTASAVCSVTDTPPTLLVCMNKASRSHAYFVENKILTVKDLTFMGIAAVIGAGIFSTIGKASFEVKALKENLEQLVMDLKKLKPSTSKGVYLKKITLSTTMGPGLMIDLGSLAI